MKHEKIIKDLAEYVGYSRAMIEHQKTTIKNLDKALKKVERKLKIKIKKNC